MSTLKQKYLRFNRLMSRLIMTLPEPTAEDIKRLDELEEADKDLQEAIYAIKEDSE